MAAGDVNIRQTAYTITADGTHLQTLSLPVVVAGSRITVVFVQAKAPELDLVSVTTNQTIDGAATTQWKVAGPVGAVYNLRLSVTEIDTN